MHVEFSRVELYKKKMFVESCVLTWIYFYPIWNTLFFGAQYLEFITKKSFTKPLQLEHLESFASLMYFFLCLPVKLHFVTLSTMIPAQESLRPKTKILRGLFISKYHLNDIYFIFYIIIFFISNLLLILTN